ncbi:hypothetical protein NDU88_007897 [Pleurodeles waltl]|uniref:Uncharacterized protein n=1 Tax=Pleurodeles waltl TaxID=8319 RepID=A0AAV7RUB0_PLEWA|nr:hypothetical protein NDU88_007897 [Pleurodeles waltl]
MARHVAGAGMRYSDDDVFMISLKSHSDCKKKPPPMYNIMIDRVMVPARIDTEASVSIMDLELFKALCFRLALEPTTAKIYA